MFEAAARHQSYTKAADELAVTQGAVSRQIGSLERFLGVPLFQRSRRGVALTDAGQTYARQVRARLDAVERDALDLMAQRGLGGVLELGVVPTFGTRWLLPRLPSFLQAQPGIQIHLAARARPFLFADSGLDAAIHAGVSAWPGTESVFLMRESLVAVCSPAVAGARRKFGAADWRRHTLLQLSTRPYAWREWFAAAGLSIEGDVAGPRMELFSMLAEAAVRGIGVALVPPFLVEDELARGLLVTVSDKPRTGERSYYLIYPEGTGGSTALRVFRAWLQTEAEEYRRATGLE